MSLKIIKSGMLDSIQDRGRFGYGHLGINPSGVMDLFSAQMANILVGNPIDEPVMELHFPSSIIQFASPAIIALTGGDFTPTINGDVIPVAKTIWVARNTTLQFTGPVRGARSYLAVHGGLVVNKWLNSASTHFKAMTGGWQGRKLMKDDVIPMKILCPYLPNHQHQKTELLIRDEIVPPVNLSDEIIKVLPGKEWPWMTHNAQRLFTAEPFTITLQSDRMGYRLQGPALLKEKSDEVVSGPVTFGTIQLLPEGNLIVLMADHQTTGGYPVIGHVISAHHSMLAQMNPGDTLRFQITDLRTAEQLWEVQHKFLVKLQHDHGAKLEPYLEKKH